MSFLFIQNEVNYEVAPGTEFTATDIRTTGVRTVATTGNPDLTRATFDGDAAVHDNSFCRLTQVASNAKGIMWIHFLAHAATGVDMWLGDNNALTGNPLLKIEVGSDKLDVMWNTSGSFTGVEMVSPSVADLFFVDIKLDTNEGSCTVYLDENKVHESTADADLKNLDLSQISVFRQSGLRQAPTQMVITETFDTIGIRLLEAPPEKAGPISTAAGKFTDVAELGLDTEAYRFYGSSKQTLKYNFLASGFDVSKYDILAVSVGTVANAQETATHRYLKEFTIDSNGDRIYKEGGTILDESSANKSIQSLHTVVPATNTPWTWTDVTQFFSGMETFRTADIILDNVELSAGARWGLDSTGGRVELMEDQRGLVSVQEAFFDNATGRLRLKFEGGQVDGNKTSIVVNLLDDRGNSESATLTYVNDYYEGLISGEVFTSYSEYVYINIGA